MELTPDGLRFITDLSYLAGIIDGEGCINISTNYDRGRNYYRLILDVTNTSYILMQWLEDNFGGIVGTSYARKENRTDMYGWTASGNQAQELFKLVLPYLKIKKPQAELALQMNISPYGGASRWSYSVEEEANRELIYQEMKLLNRKNGNKGSYQRKNNTQKEVNVPSQGPCGTVVNSTGIIK